MYYLFLAFQYTKSADDFERPEKYECKVSRLGYEARWRMHLLEAHRLMLGRRDVAALFECARLVSTDVSVCPPCKLYAYVHENMAACTVVSISLKPS